MKLHNDTHAVYPDSRGAVFSLLQPKDPAVLFVNAQRKYTAVVFLLVSVHARNKYTTAPSSATACVIKIVDSDKYMHSIKIFSAPLSIVIRHPSCCMYTKDWWQPSGFLSFSRYGRRLLPFFIWRADFFCYGIVPINGYPPLKSSYD